MLSKSNAGSFDKSSNLLSFHYELWNINNEGLFNQSLALSLYNILVCIIRLLEFIRNYIPLFFQKP